MPRISKSDEFSEKFQTAFDPPPLIFGKLYCGFRDKIATKVRIYIHMEELLCILWSYFPWDACSTNVQHGNRVKTYPKRPFCITFMRKKPCLKVQILQYKFLDWKWPPHPFGTFPKIHPLWSSLIITMIMAHPNLSKSPKYQNCRGEVIIQWLLKGHCFGTTP